ncbi:MAG: hypothetical protein WKG07_42685 [Hymenobacter sp.]
MITFKTSRRPARPRLRNQERQAEHQVPVRDPRVVGPERLHQEGSRHVRRGTARRQRHCPRPLRRARWPLPPKKPAS